MTTTTTTYKRETGVATLTDGQAEVPCGRAAATMTVVERLIRHRSGLAAAERQSRLTTRDGIGTRLVRAWRVPGTPEYGRLCMAAHRARVMRETPCPACGMPLGAHDPRPCLPVAEVQP